MRVALLIISICLLSASFAITLKPLKQGHLASLQHSKTQQSPNIDLGAQSLLQSSEEEYEPSVVLETLVEIKEFYKGELAGPQGQLNTENTNFQNALAPL